ncbi:hypothetical protein CA233_15105 [Sphingomonas sp. ABOLD]|uniref:Uncharacterized protein n=1 Tax=Sphingomonas trueperi TaxID=53317 RepID=A0A7X6BDH3_9SPHN|nr:MULTISPECIES: hypothetical protein [Sphingomonas]NJB98295.1 hypothetical protein [Sphingomonas trueperi]RSV44783.1 hypothetical protein CA233_15105 [Sphingomonas sp. ABOLD]RSV45467.1 hypothetical protein CA234_01045 [Sphingomonas sp. ABOLE]
MDGIEAESPGDGCADSIAGASGAASGVVGTGSDGNPAGAAAGFGQAQALSAATGFPIRVRPTK